MSILTPPLSKRGILKALGQDPSKSDVLTVSTNSYGVVKLVGGGGAIVTLDRLGASFVDNVGAANPNDGKMRGIAAASHQPTSNPRCAEVEKLAQWGPNLERERNQQMIDFMHQEFQFRRHDDEERK